MVKACTHLYALAIIDNYMMVYMVEKDDILLYAWPCVNQAAVEPVLQPLYE